MFKFLKKSPLFTHSKKEPKDLKGVLESLEEVARELKELKKESQKTLQKFGVVRFNPFKEIGGEQSFSIAVLDANNNGFVITSHYGRESNRVYAKPIENGQSKYQLSKEEKQAIDHALSS